MAEVYDNQGKVHQTVVQIDPTTGEPVTGGGGGGAGDGLTDAQLRATPVPVSVSGVATSALQTTLNGQVGALTVAAATAPDVASASTNALLRGIFAELRAQTALLTTIANNTTPAG